MDPSFSEIFVAKFDLVLCFTAWSLAQSRLRSPFFFEYLHINKISCKTIISVQHSTNRVQFMK